MRSSGDLTHHRKNVIEPKSDADKGYVLAHEGESLSNSVLPSGVRVPKGDELTEWRAIEGLLVRKLSPSTSFVISGFERLDDGIIAPTNEIDLNLIVRAEGTRFSGAKMPSGAVVPHAPEGYAWVASEGVLKIKRIAA